jgi:hypothetical protein
MSWIAAHSRADRRARDWFRAALLLAASPGVLAAPPDPAACWRELEFAAGNQWATASAVLHFLKPSGDALAAQLRSPEDAPSPLPATASTSLLRASFDAMMSHGELLLWFDRDTGGVLQMLRTGSGRESRRKLHRFLADGVWRERRAPDGSAGADSPESWQVRSRAVIPYPAALLPGEPVLASTSLIAQAARFAAAPGSAPARFVVLSDTHFHRVTLREMPARHIDTALTVQTGTGERRIEGGRPVQRIALDHELLEGEPGEDPLRLLELEGDLQIAIDTETRLPVRVQGTWLRVGTVPVNLVRARLDAGCAD